MKIKILLFTLLMVNLYANKTEGRNVYLVNCAACHSITMQGSVGKDFNLVSYTRTKKDIMHYASDPQTYFRKFGYTANAMPTLPLTQQEIEDVADYISSLQPFKEWMVKK